MNKMESCKTQPFKTNLFTYILSVYPQGVYLFYLFIHLKIRRKTSDIIGLPAWLRRFIAELDMISSEIWIEALAGWLSMSLLRCSLASQLPGLRHTLWWQKAVGGDCAN